MGGDSTLWTKINLSDSSTKNEAKEQSELHAQADDPISLILGPHCMTSWPLKTLGKPGRILWLDVAIGCGISLPGIAIDIFFALGSNADLVVL